MRSRHEGAERVLPKSQRPVCGARVGELPQSAFFKPPHLLLLLERLRGRVRTQLDQQID